MLLQGTVKTYFADRGFGFFRRDDGERDVFFHISAAKSCGLSEDDLRERRPVEFDIENRNGKTVACDIRLMG